ncbi:MAG: hypothetical protein GX117_13555 [Candidatus Hydrogenedentes bacterium]|jgi:hypothetical protein|nr:hypothetical protein [Candidatus Hydrogenedentota bacterium]
MALTAANQNTSQQEHQLKRRTGKPWMLLITNAFYLLLVFGWTVGNKPTGKDFAALTRPDLLGAVTGRLFSAMIAAFSTHCWLYYLTNLLLLYLCMVLILILCRVLGRGPWWLGSVAAVLFMAHPLKTEAVLTLSGIQFLLPTVCALLLLLLYTRCRDSASTLVRWLPPVAYLALILSFPDMIPLFLVLIILDFCFYRKREHAKPVLWAIFIIGISAFLISGQWAVQGAWLPDKIVLSLFLIVYPIGMLPDTIAFFANHLLITTLCFILFLYLMTRLLRNIKDPLVTFGVLATFAFHLLQGGEAVDPVHLSGSGRMVMLLALFALSLGSMFHVFMRSERWRSTVVRNSTLLCVAAMLSQGWVNWHWRQAGLDVQSFQETAQQTVEQHPGQWIGLLPNISYVGTVPLMYSQAIRYDTPFSRALPVQSLLELPVLPSAAVKIEEYNTDSFEVYVSNPALPKFSIPKRLTRAWWYQRHRPQEEALFRRDAKNVPFPILRIPPHKARLIDFQP